MLKQLITGLNSDYKETLDRAAKTEKGSWENHRFIVALDVEWKPATHDNQAPIAILKLCVGSRSHVVDQLPRSLHRFLEDDNLRFVGLDIECVARKLEKDFDFSVKRVVDLRDLISRCYQLPKSLHRFLEDDNLRFVRLDIECVARKLEKKFNLDVKRAVDLRDLVAENYPRKEKEVKSLDLMGLDKIVLRSKEIERPRDVIVSNWNQKYLTQSQIMYAVVDAYVTFKIGDGLNFTYHYSTPSVLD
ncbi:hypothetical protein C5167_008233 [Papaver somniferum]|uniref:3'-5' exonuclease domain-containing protein n=1 Tax=Papaver somniferum TaxID=3469 RepID=A0A4Y7JTY2_PAPSO|nr:hypothetical protein C5167_008233 [Papaver somniferum]